MQAYGVEYLDIVEMKNGNIHKGKIIENKINEYVMLELIGGASVYKLKYEDIDSIKAVAQVEEKKEDTASTAPATNTFVSRYGEDSIWLTSQFEDVKYGDLKSLNVDLQRLLDININNRVFVYEDLRKENWGWYFGGNLLIPGLGSLIQGDTGFGVYEMVSYLVYGAVLLGLTADGSYLIDSPLFIVATANMAVAGVIGWFRPAVFQNNFNKELKRKMQIP